MMKPNFIPAFNKMWYLPHDGPFCVRFKCLYILAIITQRMILFVARYSKTSFNVFHFHLMLFPLVDSLVHQTDCVYGLPCSSPLFQSRVSQMWNYLFYVVCCYMICFIFWIVVNAEAAVLAMKAFCGSVDSRRSCWWFGCPGRGMFQQFQYFCHILILVGLDLDNLCDLSSFSFIFTFS